jgi:hypothetical protein
MPMGGAVHHHVAGRLLYLHRPHEPHYSGATAAHAAQRPLSPHDPHPLLAAASGLAQSPQALLRPAVAAARPMGGATMCKPHQLHDPHPPAAGPAQWPHLPHPHSPHAAAAAFPPPPLRAMLRPAAGPEPWPRPLRDPRPPHPVAVPCLGHPRWAVLETPALVGTVLAASRSTGGAAADGVSQPRLPQSSHGPHSPAAAAAQSPLWSRPHVCHVALDVLVVVSPRQVQAVLALVDGGPIQPEDHATTDVWAQEVPGPWPHGWGHLTARVDLTPAACTVPGKVRHLPAARAGAGAGHGDVLGLCRREVAEAADQDRPNQSPVAGLAHVARGQTPEAAQSRRGQLPMGAPTAGTKVETGSSGLATA